MRGPTEEIEVTLGPDAEGHRLDSLVAVHAGIPRSRLEIVTLTVDGAAARGKDRVGAGSRIRASYRDRAGDIPDPDASLDIEVVYEDDDVVVVDKPAGVPVHPPRGAPSRGGTLVNALLARYPDMAAGGRHTFPGAGTERPGIVHRIDRMTSGLLVVARSARAFEGLSGQVRRRGMDRVYAALCGGRFSTASGVIDAPVGRRPGSRRLEVEANGKPARSMYAVEAAWGRPEVTAVSVTLETGRTHQIRVHMRAIGHPVVGDPSYGGRILPGADRQMLHAAHLGFEHPVSGEPLAFDSPVPADMAGVLRTLGPPERGEIPSRWLAQRIQP